MSSTNQTPNTTGKVGMRTFFRQVADELRKVVRPTGQELINYTWIVLVFVVVMMGFISLLDTGFSRLMVFVFSNGAATPQ